MNDNDWQESTGNCPYCEVGKVVWRDRESSDCHDDTQYKCLGCLATWWDEGSDY